MGAERGVSQDDLLMALQSAAAGTQEDFIPQLVLHIDYSVFVQQMAARAAEFQAAAQPPAPTSSGDFNGTYVTQPADSQALDQFMAAEGVPWVFRKMFVSQAAAGGTQVIVEHAGGRAVFIFKMKWFGARRMELVLDGQEYEIDGLLRTKRYVTTWEPGDGTIRTVGAKVPGRGDSNDVPWVAGTFWFHEDGVLMWERALYVPGQAEPVKFTMVLLRT